MTLWDYIIKWHNEIQGMSEMVHMHGRKIKQAWLSLQKETRKRYLGFMLDVCITHY